MAKGLIKIKMNARDFKELYMVYDVLLTIYTPENSHELLLMGHITELREKMGERHVDVTSYTMTLCGTEALAFMQLWAPKDIALTPLQGRVIQEIFNALDKEMKNPNFKGAMKKLIKDSL